ncbi:MAG: hypothetical protein ABIK15_12145 [Pseudomonadota bacterium]
MTGYKSEYEDEIKLIDIVRIIWKWKYLIIAGSLVFGFIAGVINYIAWKNTPQSFKTTMVLKLGVKSIDIRGNEQYIDSLENMKSLIEGELKYKIISYSEGKDEFTSVIPVDLSASIQNGLNIMEVSCISNPPEVGAKRLDLLIRLIKDKYVEKEKSIQNELSVINKSGIEEKKEMIATIASNNNTLEMQLTIISNRLEELRSKLRELEIQSKQLLQHEKILAQQNNLSSSLFYFNIIQKNMDFEYQIRQDIYKSLIEKEDIGFRLKKNVVAAEKLQQEIDRLEGRIKDKGADTAVKAGQASIEQFRDDTSAIDPRIVRVIQTPASQPIEKENKIRLTVTLSLIAGMFFWFCIIILIEYIRKHRGKNNG